MNKQVEALFESQKQAFEYWSKMAEQFAQQATPNKAGETHPFADWFAKQQEFFQQAYGQPNPFQAQPDQLRQWMELQRQYADNWLNFMRSAGAPGLPAWMPGSDPASYVEESMKQWKDWLQQGQGWANAQLLEHMPYTMQPHFKNFLSSTELMRKYWEPITRMIENGLMDHDIVSKYFSRDAYHEFVDKVMGFKAIGNVSEVVDNINTWFERYLSWFNQEDRQWADLAEQWKNKVQASWTQGHAPLFQMASDLNNSMRDQLLPFYNVMAQGRQTEIAKLTRDLQFAYVGFILKSAELQTKAYDAGQYALPDTIRAFHEDYRKTGELPDFNAFLDHYINRLEDTLLEVLHSDAYSQVQSEVASTAAHLKALNEQIMERAFEDMPFLTRTDGDDIAKETHALRTKVRQLEERLAALEGKGEKKKNPPPANGLKGSPRESLLDRIGHAPAGRRDDLKAIKGIGPKLEGILHDIGITSYEQIKRMTPQDYQLLDEMLDRFQGRAQRDHWAEQAAKLLG